MEPVRAGIQTTDLEFAGRGVHIALHAGPTVLAVGCRAGNGLCTIVNSVFGNTVSITGLRVIGGRAPPHHSTGQQLRQMQGSRPERWRPVNRYTGSRLALRCP